HYPAVALACVPALAALAIIFADKFLGVLAAQGIAADALPDALHTEVGIVRVLANGFIVTSLLWASLLAMLIDRRLSAAAGLAVLMAAVTLFGVMRLARPGGAMFLRWQLSGPDGRVPWEYGAGYFLVAVVLVVWETWAAKGR